jgi:hypothetical protein
MSNPKSINIKENISDRGKHRLRIAARFLRQRGFHFNGDNFYLLVINSLIELDQETQAQLRGVVDWVEQYEIVELKIYGEPPRSRSRKSKPMLGMKRILGASPTQNPERQY